MSVEQDALGFEDQDDVLWVRTVHDSGRFGAEELVGLVDLLKHVLSVHTQRDWLEFIIHSLITRRSVAVRTLPSGFLSGWYFWANLKYAFLILLSSCL